MLSWRTHAISGTIGGSSLARAKPALALLSLARRLQSSKTTKPGAPSVRYVPPTRNPKSLHPDSLYPQSPVPQPLVARPRGRYLPLWRTKRFAYERISTSAIILQRLYARSFRMTREQWELFQSLAQQRSTRLPVMTAQMLLRLEEDLMPTSLSERLADDVDPYHETSWNSRLAMVAHTGITEEHIRHWAWILRGETADARVRRFLKRDILRPVFLLFIMVSKHHTIFDRELFMSLLDYVDKTHCQPSTQTAGQRPGYRALDLHLSLSPEHFIKLLHRLIDQALRLCPEALLKIAEMTTAYLRTLLVSPSKYDNGFTAQCRVLNRALVTLSRRSHLQPYANTEYNWEAQKHLITYSTSLKRALIINEAGYRAIQSVMVGRPKSEAEEKVAIRSARTWPPYREAWDGVDEQRRPEDDLSRAVKTGILAREAGYPETEIDRALGAVGGAILGEGPFVQTRSHPLRLRTGNRMAENAYITAAAKVRATRNAQEAWAVFQRTMQEGLRPSALIYGEMFAKLLAREVDDPATAVPGSTKEVMPVYQPGNLSEFEKWRLQPPTVKELYEHMLQSGVRPQARVLAMLIPEAGSEDQVLDYLEASPYRKFTSAVADRDRACPPKNENFFTTAEIYKSVPLTVFGAYIKFLCKTQRHVYFTSTAHNAAHRLTGPAEPAMTNHYLLRALAVVAVRLRPDTSEGRTYKPPWYEILRTLILARTHNALVTVARKQLVLFLDVFKWVRGLAGMDVVLLEIMCLSVGRVMAANFTGSKQHTSGKKWWTRANHVAGAGEDYTKALARAWVDVMAAFEEMKKPGSGMGGFHVYVYLRVLGMYGALDEMEVVMRWVLARLEDAGTTGMPGGGLRGALEEGTLSHDYLLRAFGFVEGYLMQSGREEQGAAIRARRGDLVGDGYPLRLEEVDTDADDLMLVRDIAKGWREVYS